MLVNLEYKRQSGRTSRMTEAAIAAFKSGKPVYIMVLSEHYSVQEMMRLLKDYPEIIVERESKAEEFDWFQQKFLKGPYVNHEVFVDHQVFEGVFRKVLDSWTRFDLPPDSIPGLAINPAEVAILVESSNEERSKNK
jgi:hypothetical protein